MCMIVYIYVPRFSPLTIHVFSNQPALMCTNLPAPDNGIVIYSTDTTSPYDFGTVATYICDTGFGLTGEATQTCDGYDSSPIGVWSGQASICDGQSIMSIYT